MNYKSRRHKYELIRSQLENERTSFVSHWKDLGEYILPRRPRFTTNDVNKGDKRHTKIINSTATLASRTIRSGMMSGVTSPARPWFRLTTQDPEMVEVSEVKFWLDTVTKRMAHIFIKSNLYNVLPVIYGDMAGFGTACMTIEEDFERTVRFYHFPIGSYMLANDAKMRPRVFFREFRLTIRQLVEKFGEQNPETGEYKLDKFSLHVQNQWKQGQLEQWIDICHCIMPNEDYKPNSPLSKHKRFSSVYYEKGTYGAKGSGSYIRLDDSGKFLSESGFNFFPVLAPRWEVQAEDVYGTDCPGMAALGDIKALQIMEKRKAQAVEKSINPPMVGPVSLRNTKTSILPGDITYADERDGMKGFRPAHEVRMGTADIREDIREHEQRISRSFYEDLFLMLAQSDRRQITAREIDERHEEKLLALGPVLEQINQDLLDPLIDITFQIMERQGLIPKPPEELQGQDLKVEYISIMAQAQKLVGIAGIERFAGFASQVASVNPEALDKVDTDQILDVYAEMTSIPPGIVREDDAVAGMRDQRAKAQQAQQMTEMINQSANAAKNLSQADLDGDNALTRLTEQSEAGQLTQTGG